MPKRPARSRKNPTLPALGKALAPLIEELENRLLLAGNGLAGVYYNTSDLGGSPVAARVDPTVNFSWSGAPAANVNADHFSVQWTGKLMPLYTGKYNIITTTDDGVRVYVNGSLLIDDWNVHAAKTNIGTAILTAGQLADIRMDFFDSSGGATAQLSWYSKSQHQEIIPTSQLYAADLPVISPPPVTAAPNVPGGFAAAALSSSQIRLSWQDVAGESGYKLQRSTDGAAWSQIATPLANATSYTDGGLAANASYFYRLAASNSAGDSAFTSAASAKTQGTTPPPPPASGVPAMPMGFSATAISSSQVQLSWEDVAGETIYKLERTADGKNWSQIAAPPADSTSYVDGRVSASTTYLYRLRCANTFGNSQMTPAISVTTPPAGTTPPPTAPAAPAGFAAASLSSSQIKLTWQDVSDETGYALERSSDGVNNWSQIAAPAANATSYTDSGLAANTTYFYRLRAANLAGNSAYTAVSSAKTQNTVTPPPASGVPATPANFSAVALSASQVQLTWDDVANETIYKIERSADGKNWSQIAAPAADSTSYIDTRVSPNTTYLYRMRCANSFGDSQMTGRVGVTTPSGGTTPPPVTPPAAPGGLSAASLSSSQIKLNWQDVANESTYLLERSSDGVSNWNQIAAPAANSTSYTDGNLSANTTYYYRLRAGNSAGNSGYTSVASAKTQVIITPPPANGNYQPDALIQIHHDTTFVGDNVYNTTGAGQTREGTTDFYGTPFQIRVYNDGKTADSFIVKGPAGDANWRVTYYDSFVFGWNGGKDISAAVEGGGWNTGNIDPGTYRDFRCETLALAAPGGDARSLTFTVTSAHDPSKVDVVKGTVTNPVTHAVAWRRQNFGPGTTYLMSVQNQGDLPDQVDITAALAAGAGSTWNAQFFDDNFGGNDITAAVRSGAGWKTKVLQPWESQEFRVVFNYTDAKLPSVQFTASSVAKPDSKEQLTVNVGAAEPFPVSAATDVFPIGVWTQPVSSFDKWKSRGVNTLIEYQGDGATIEQWSQAARDRGMYYIRQPLSNPSLDKGDKNLLAWALPDEPEITTKYSPATLQSWVDGWKAADPTRPVWVNFSGGYVLHWQGNVTASGYQPYLNTTDWDSSSIYPVTGWNRPEPNPGLSAPGQAVDRLEKWTNGAPQWAVIEPSDQELSWIQKEIPGPTTGQFRAEVWDSVIHGARGIIYFPESFSPGFKFDNTSPELAAEMTSVDAKLQSIAGALESDIDPPTRGLQVDGPLEGTWRVYNGKTYYVVLNFSDQTVTKNVTLQGIGAASSAVLNGEGRNVTLSNGTLTDTFAPFEVHVYEVG